MAQSVSRFCGHDAICEVDIFPRVQQLSVKFY